MTKDEAQMIFQSWREYMETADKLDKLMLHPPQSFLPYPIAIIDEALNIVAKDYFDAGDGKTAETIQATMASYLSGYFMSFADGKLVSLQKPRTDEEMLEDMKRSLDLILGDEDLKKTVLDNLKKSQDSWIEVRKSRANIKDPLASS
jgi:hypothetical protein